jgi:hypothetical protein
VGATLGADALRFGVACVRSRTALAAEILFWRKHLALYREREVTPRRATAATRLVLVLLARVVACRDALLLVQPATLIRWHRQAFRLLAAGLPAPPLIGHRLPSDSRVVERSILGGLHHENGLEK